MPDFVLQTSLLGEELTKCLADAVHHVLICAQLRGVFNNLGGKAVFDHPVMSQSAFFKRNPESSSSDLNTPKELLSLGVGKSSSLGLVRSTHFLRRTPSNG